jgi:hypothetical protein
VCVEGSWCGRLNLNCEKLCAWSGEVSRLGPTKTEADKEEMSLRHSLRWNGVGAIHAREPFLEECEEDLPKQEGSSGSCGLNGTAWPSSPLGHRFLHGAGAC